MVMQTKEQQAAATKIDWENTPLRKIAREFPDHPMFKQVPTQPSNRTVVKSS